MASSLQSELRAANEELVLVNEQLSSLRKRKNQLQDKISSLKGSLQVQNNVNTSKSIYDKETFSWSKEMRQKLEVFKIKDFRSLQRTAINATLSKVDCLLVMPTGGGKSLCFQLPAIMSSGLSLVVSPLISLMEDQVMGLNSVGISSRIFNAQTTREETASLYKAMIDPKSDVRMLYVTPEKLAKSKRLMSQLEKVYQQKRLIRLVIDEVHCCSQWGHDFRPDYKFLNIMKTQFPETPILGLTATATSSVILDVQKILNIEGCLVLKDSFFRANLKYEVRETNTRDNYEELSDVIETRFRKQSGIIYCLTIKDTEEVASQLKKKGLKADCYHAQLEMERRSSVHKRWYSGALQVIVATVAFGMGINKMDVRFVIHYSMSKSLENYYQETGRAGRDGKTAHCILFYRFSDVFRCTSLFFTEKNALAKVYTMLNYCINHKDCRKGLMAVYFGDKPPSCSQMCDNCSDANNISWEKVDAKALLQDILLILKQAHSLKERMTALKLMDALFSKGNKRLRVTGVQVPRISRETCQHVVIRLILDNYLKEEFHFTPYSTISYLVSGSKAPIVSKISTIFYEFPKKGKRSSSSVSLSESSSSQKRVCLEATAESIDVSDTEEIFLD